MAVTREDSREATGTSQPTVQVLLNSSPTEGHLILGALSCSSAFTWSSTPTGWTEIANSQGSGDRPNISLWYKIAGSSEATSFVWTPSSNRSYVSHGVVYSGVNTLDQSTTNNGTDSSLESGVINVAAEERLLLAHFGNFNGTWNGLTSGGYTEIDNGTWAGIGGLVAEKITSAGGNQECVAAMTGDANWASVHASFSNVTAGGDSGPIMRRRRG